MSPFESASTIKQHAYNEFTWHANASWFQGRGAYGGLTLAAMLRAGERQTKLPIRRVHAELCAPVTDEACTLQVHAKRRGSNTDFISVDVTQANECVAYASLTFGARRTKKLDRSLKITPPPVDTNPLPKNPMMPAFTHHFEYRVADDGCPLMGNQATLVKSSGWIDFREPTRRDAALVVGLMDAWWPAVMTAASEPRPMATISFTADFAEPVQESDGPFFLEVETAHVSDGYSMETDKLWNQNGALLAQAQQLIAVIK